MRCHWPYKQQTAGAKDNLNDADDDNDYRQTPDNPGAGIGFRGLSNQRSSNKTSRVSKDFGNQPCGKVQVEVKAGVKALQPAQKPENMHKLPVLMPIKFRPDFRLFIHFSFNYALCLEMLTNPHLRSYG